jgi:hypothetical protein
MDIHYTDEELFYRTATIPQQKNKIKYLLKILYGELEENVDEILELFDLLQNKEFDLIKLDTLTCNSNIKSLYCELYEIYNPYIEEPEIEDYDDEEEYETEEEAVDLTEDDYFNLGYIV